jgi:hypothetical protein
LNENFEEIEQEDNPAVGTIQELAEEQQQIFDERVDIIRDALENDPNIILLPSIEVIRGRNSIRNSYRHLLNNSNTAGRAEQLITGLQRVYSTDFQEDLITSQYIINVVGELARSNIPDNQIVNQLVNIVRAFIREKIEEQLSTDEPYWLNYLNLSGKGRTGGMVEEEEEDVGIIDKIIDIETEPYNEKIQQLRYSLRNLDNRLRRLGYMSRGTIEGNEIEGQIILLQKEIGKFEGERDKLIEDIKSQNIMERLRDREIKMGRGMCGGMVEDENFGVFINPQQFIERRRQLHDELRELNEMWEGTDEGLEKAQKIIEDKIELLTLQMEEQQEIARIGLMNYLKNREIKKGRGMSGGVSIQFSNGLFEFNTSSPYRFYRSVIAYYFLQRPQRKQEFQQALRDAPNFVRQQERGIIRDFQNNWNEFLDILNGDNMTEKRRIVGATEIDIGGIIDAVIDGSVYTESEVELSSSDEEEGAGMHGGAGVGIFSEDDLGEYEDVFNTTTSVMSILTKLTKFIDKHGGNKDVVRQRLLSSYIHYVPNSSKEQRRVWISKFDRYANLGEEEEGAGMCGGKFGDATDPLTFALYLVGALVGVPLTTATFNYLYNIYQSNRQIIDDAMTDTTGSVSDVDSVMGDEGAGMSGGVVLPQFDVNIGRAFRDAKRRWAKSPKMFENLAYERRLFDDKYGKLMRYIRIVSGQGDLDNTSYVELLMYSNWVKDLDIPEISKGAGKKAKKAKKGKN